MVEDQSSPENPLEQEPRSPFPEQQPLPGLESEMPPRPDYASSPTGERQTTRKGRAYCLSIFEEHSPCSLLLPLDRCSVA
jgi:hypothetical protein